MSKILDQLAKLSAKDARAHVRIDELGWDVYVPRLTVQDRSRCRAGIDPNDEDELVFNSVLMMAETEDGSKFFGENISAEERAQLRQLLPFDVVMRIATATEAADPGQAKNA